MERFVFAETVPLVKVEAFNASPKSSNGCCKSCGSELSAETIRFVDQSTLVVSLIFPFESSIAASCLAKQSVLGSHSIDSDVSSNRMSNSELSHSCCVGFLVGKYNVTPLDR